MIIDMHIHVAGRSNKYGNHIDDSLFNSWLFKKALSRYGITEEKLTLPKDQFDELVIEKITDLIDASLLDYGMLLALDAAYDESGKKITPLSQLIVSNDFIFEFSKRSKKVLCGCSVHPYREDALAELERCIKMGAKAIKWLPSAQNIDLDNPKCIPFYEMLIKYNIPLLVHIGKEHTLKGHSQKLNDIKKLSSPLNLGVKVIAAHLGTQLLLHEKCFFNSWCKLTERYENLYGDVSAFIVPTRTRFIHKILKSKKLTKRVLYGSDFPCVNFPIYSIFSLGLKEYLEIKKEPNIFNETYLCYSYLGLKNENFSKFLSI